MRGRFWEVAERREGGWFSIAGGTLWQVVEAAHNWTYVCDLAHKAGFFSAVLNLAHPSALSMVALGATWVWLIGRLRHRPKPIEIIPPARPVGSNEAIRAVLSCKEEVFLHLHQDESGSDLTIVKRAAR